LGARRASCKGSAGTVEHVSVERVVDWQRGAHDGVASRVCQTLAACFGIVGQSTAESAQSLGKALLNPLRAAAPMYAVEVCSSPKQGPNSSGGGEEGGGGGGGSGDGGGERGGAL